MKRFLIYFSIILGFVSCSSSDQKISQSEFERLFAHDSIQSIKLNTNIKEAKIVIRSLDKNNITYILPIESVESFESSFAKLNSKLRNQNIRPSYNMSTVSGGLVNAYILSPLLFICSLILFLIAVIDVLRNRFETVVDKLIWFLVVFLIPLIGPILYMFIGRNQKLQK